MVDKLNGDLAKELLTYISCFEEELLDKIPDTLLSKLNNLASFSDNSYYIDVDKSLDEQDMSDECRNFLYNRN